MNPLTQLRKLGIAIVGKDGILDTAAAAAHGFGPMAKVKLQEEARDRMLKEQRDQLGLQAAGLEVDQAKVGLDSSKFRSERDKINAPLETEGKVLDNSGKQTRLIGDTLENANKGLDLRNKEEQDRIRRAAARFIAPSLGVTEDEAYAKVLANEEIFKADAGKRFDRTEDRQDARNAAAIAAQERADIRRVEAERNRDKTFGFKTVQEINKIAQQTKTSARYRDDTNIEIKAQDMERLFNNFVNDPKNNSRGGVAVQAVINNFNKILDPASVVREGEYVRTVESLAAADRIKGFIEKLSRGNPIPLETMRLYVQDSKIIAKAAKERRQEAINSFKAQIKMIPGIDDATIEEATMANFGQSGNISGSSGLTPAQKKAMGIK